MYIRPEGYVGTPEAMKRPEVAAFVERMESLRTNPRTIDKKLFCIRIFLDWLKKNGNTPLRDVTPRDMETFLTAQRDAGLAGATIDGLFCDLRVFFRFLEKTQWVFASPMTHLKPRWAPKKLKSVPTEDDMRRLLAAPNTNSMFGLRNRALLEVAYSTGARSGELIGMTIFDPDLDKGIVRVMGKGSKERVIPMGRQAVFWVQKYLQASRPRLLKQRIDVHALWVGHDGSALKKSSLGVIFGKYRRETGIKTEITPHALRRACATHLLRNGAHPVQVQMLLGHATLNTLSQYLLVTVRDLKNMHQKSKVGR